MMKKFQTILLSVLTASVFYAGGAFAAQQVELPKPVKETLDRQLDDNTVRGVRKQTRDGKTSFVINAQSPHNRRLTIVIDDGGKLLEKYYEGFSVKNGRLMRDGRPFTIQSFYTPEAGDPALYPKSPIEAISKFSYVGGNLIAFDLYGLNPDGIGLTSEAQEFYKNLVSRLSYTSNIHGIIRLFNKTTPKDLTYRYNLVRTAAQFFGGNYKFIYWIDGPRADLLTKVFKLMAPELTVAGPGGDLSIVESKKDVVDAEPVIPLLRSLPKEFPQGHFLLTDKSRNYKALDRHNARPEERQSWKPDNSNVSPEERKQGFVSLFDGETSQGWIPVNPSQKGFIVKDGTLERRPGGGTIRTVKRYDDFILRFDFLIEPNGNSGVQVRCPRSNRQSKIGFEMQILGDYGKEPTPDCTGAIYTVVAPSVNASKPGGEWNTAEIYCDGPHVKITINGIKVIDLSVDDYDELKYRLRDGFILLTDHNNHAAYRNIRIKEL